MRPFPLAAENERRAHQPFAIIGLYTGSVEERNNMANTYTPDDINEKLKDFSGWTLGDDGQLHKEFTFENFLQALTFANAVGHLADAANHHPDVHIYSYKNLRLDLMDHEADGISDKDFALVGQIETLPRRSS